MSGRGDDGAMLGLKQNTGGRTDGGSFIIQLDIIVMGRATYQVINLSNK